MLEKLYNWCSYVKVILLKKMCKYLKLLFFSEKHLYFSAIIQKCIEKLGTEQCQYLEGGLQKIMNPWSTL